MARAPVPRGEAPESRNELKPGGNRLAPEGEEGRLGLPPLPGEGSGVPTGQPRSEC
jgi:hypothetical protein